MASPGRQLEHEPSKMFVGPVLGQKLSKNTSLNGYQMNGQPGVTIGTGALKNVRWPCSRPKTFKEYQFERVPNEWPARGGNWDTSPQKCSLALF